MTITDSQYNKFYIVILTIIYAHLMHIFINVFEREMIIFK